MYVYLCIYCIHISPCLSTAFCTCFNTVYVGEEEEKDEEDEETTDEEEEEEEHPSSNNQSAAKAHASPTASPPLDIKTKLAADLLLLNGAELAHVVTLLEARCPQALVTTHAVPDTMEAW